MVTFKGDLTVFISLHDYTVIVSVVGLDELTFETILLALGYAVRNSIIVFNLSLLTSAGCYEKRTEYHQRYKQ